MVKRRLLAALAAGVVVPGLLAGCAGVSAIVSKITVGQAISQAVKADRRLPGLRFTVGFGVTPAKLAALAAAAGAHPSAAEVRALSTLRVSVVVRTVSGEPLDTPGVARTPGAVDTALLFDDRGATLAGIEGVDRNLYLRLRLPQLLQDFGACACKATGFESGLDRANARVHGLAALARGQWVEISRAELAQIRRAEQKAVSGGFNAKALQAETKQLVTAFRTALRHSTRLSRVATVAGRTQYDAVVNAHELVSDIAASLPATATGQMFARLLHQMAAKVPPGRTFTAELFSQAGRLVEVSVDLGQFAPSKHVSLPLVLSIAPAGRLAAPAGAVPLDLQPVVSHLGAALAPALRHLATTPAFQGLGAAAPPTGAQSSAAGANPFS